MPPGGARLPGGFGSIRLTPKPESTAPAELRIAAALENLENQLVNAPVHIIAPINLAAGGTALVKSEQNRVNTLTVTCTVGMLDLYYGDQTGNMSPQPHERFLQNTTTQLKVPANQWVFTVCAGGGVAAEGCVKLSWTN
jgi:hypothetical protein